MGHLEQFNLGKAEPEPNWFRFTSWYGLNLYRAKRVTSQADGLIWFKFYSQFDSNNFK